VWGPSTSRRSVMLGGLVLTWTIGGLLRPARAMAVGQAVEDLPIIDCAEWGARPSSEDVQVWDERPERIIVHHTATANVKDFSRGAADSVARAIQNFHMDRRGWIDTGQNFTISRGGFVLEGRHRSLEMLRSGDEHVEGAHCTGQNVVAVGIENEGTYTTTRPPGQQWERLRDLCAYICHQYEIPPTEITGHRDHKDTICPGDAFYGMLPRLRVEVADVLGDSLPEQAAQRASWPLLRRDDTGPAVRAAQHLLRAAGFTEVPADGRFDVPTAAAIREFQRGHRTEEVNGMIGGETWPLLVSIEGGDLEEVALARQVLMPGRAARASARPGLDEWLRLLSAAPRH
jgi:N-acetylmuramoyl-L-alanine amidase/Putative peptidoglycan binding domain